MSKKVRFSGVLTLSALAVAVTAGAVGGYRYFASPAEDASGLRVTQRATLPAGFQAPLYSSSASYSVKDSTPAGFTTQFVDPRGYRGPGVGYKAGQVAPEDLVYRPEWNAGDRGLAPAKAAAGSDENGGTFIVMLSEAPVASYRGQSPGLAAPARMKSKSGRLKLDPKADSSRRYAAYLQARQAKLESDVASAIDRPLAVRARMQHAVNAVVMDLTIAEAKAIESLPGVVRAEPYREYVLDTDTGPALIGAPAVWTGTNVGATAQYRGEGMVVGIIDSGINFGSPSFAATGPVDGYVHINPLGAGNYLGTCATGDVDAGRCNDKLIGGYDFVCNFSTAVQCTAANSREEPGFGDTNGHGSHTASTAAGNTRDALYSGNTIRISGVAPRANIIAYDVCYTEVSTGRGLCPNVSTVAAINQTVADGVVDAINYSIGGGRDPWIESTSLAFLNASDAGIFVATSAGNSGPGPHTMGHHEPWTSSTAAAQHGRAGFSIAMSVTGPAPVPANLAPLLVNQGTGGVAFSATIPGTTPLFISPGINTTSDGCAAYPANTFAGGIAVIRRGTCSFSIKVNNASAAGAVAVVIANNAAGTIIPSVPGTTIPVFSVPQSEGDALRNFGQANPATATAQISFPAIPVPNTADALAAFSSRGPASTYNVLKPDVTAPGVSVLAAYAGTTITGSENLVELLSGTSMASPHQAGSALLIRQARPTWTPAEVKSALAMTATQTVFLEDQVSLANPFARGSGRIRVDQAIRAGLVLNETTANYTAANPGIGGNPANLNQPNLYNRSCFPTCDFFRTFRNTSAASVTYRVQLSGLTGAVPSFITVPGNGTRTLKVSVYGYLLPANGVVSFGNLTLTPASGTNPVLRLPVGVAVQPPVISLPASISGTMTGGTVTSVYFPLGNTGGSTLNYAFALTGTGAQSIVDANSQGIASGFRNTIYTDPATAGSQAQFAADDFVVTQNTQITSLFTQGFVVSNAVLTTAATNITWSIYPDAAGFPAGNPQTNPAAAVWTYTAAPTGTGVSTVGANDINLNLVAAGQNVTLPPGRYWLLVNTRGTFANRFAQYGSNTTNGNTAGFASITIATNGTGAWVANPSLPGLTMRVAGNVPCGAPWINAVYNSSGTLAAGSSVQALAVAASASGLALGSYTGNICVNSNDPVRPTAAMPFNLTVAP